MSTIEDVSLVKEQTKPEVYFFCGETKFRIPSEQEFAAMGFRPEKVQVVPTGTLTSNVVTFPDPVPSKPFVARPTVKPSAVFFMPPCPDSYTSPPQGKTYTNCCRASSIVSHNVMVAGWLMVRQDGSNQPTPLVNEGNTKGAGIEDIHYDLKLDPNFIDRMYGNEGLSSNLAEARLPGNPSYLDRRDVSWKWFHDISETDVSRGVTMNSFSLPRRDFAWLHCEQNVWHEEYTHRWFHVNVIGRGPHPKGWIQVRFRGSDDYVYEDSWFPYHPIDPDGSGPLQVGEYVIVKGTLWQDNPHEGDPDIPICWNVGPTKGHAGWLEIHPIDWIMRPIKPPAPLPRNSAFVFDFCTPAGVAYGQTVPIFPDFDEGGKRLEGKVQALIDGRFTDMNSVARHVVTTVTDDPESLHEYPQFSVLVGGAGRPAGRFKATYVVSWKERENAAEVVGPPQVPGEMDAGGTYDVRVVMRNVGTKTWTPEGPTPYKLGSQNPRDNLTWGRGRVDLPHPVAPGSQVSFDFKVTAPSLPDFYNFRWGMVQETVKWFGDYTPNVRVRVGELAVVPNVIQAFRNAAESRIMNAGLKPKFTGSTSSRAWVDDQKPHGGTEVRPGSTVSCHLTREPPP